MIEAYFIRVTDIVQLHLTIIIGPFGDPSHVGIGHRSDDGHGDGPLVGAGVGADAEVFYKDGFDEGITVVVGLNDGGGVRAQEGGGGGQGSVVLGNGFGGFGWGDRHF